MVEMLNVKYDAQALVEKQKNMRNDDKIWTFARIGQTINLSVEKFIAIGEVIAQNNPDIKPDLSESCKEALNAGKTIERICKLTTIESINYPDFNDSLCDLGSITNAARSLLSAITRVLLLVDIVIVKQLLTTKKKISESLEKLESVLNFAEFVRAFTIFGIEMVELAYFTGNQQNAVKEERRRAQLYAARQILEHSVNILLTSSKICLVHCECIKAKENRDTIFCQIRRAMDLIHFVVKDSIFSSSLLVKNAHAISSKPTDRGTVYSTLRFFTFLLERLQYRLDNNEIVDTPMENRNEKIVSRYNMSPSYYRDDMCNELYNCNYFNDDKAIFYPNPETLSSTEVRVELLNAFDRVLEKTYDFTDSAYTSHENRQNILYLCDQCRIELNNIVSNLTVNRQYSANQYITKQIDGILQTVKELSEQLILSVADQITDFYHSLKMSLELVNNFRSLAIEQDFPNLELYSNKFHDYCDHVIDICKLLRHIAFSETLQIQAKCLAVNFRIYGPQVLTAAQILAKYPSSTPTIENFEAFVEMWKWLTSELLSLGKQVLDCTNEQRNDNTRSIKNTERIRKTYDERREVEKGNEETQELVKNDTNEMNTFNQKWNEDLSDNNDIIKRAKNMSAMAFSMYQFTKGNGELRTTQDLFTQAEYFAEEANRLYKVLRQFSYQVPASDNKKELLNILDKVPTFVQALQFTVKDHTVGKAATFVKVDHVIRETKNLMGVINKVVSKCFECANKVK
ncbi:alpha-catulin isoform X2 [Teleopsis dalmanni]|uniref:alpha-catulin isoform X2 n=1 Tax=Teleopsis dalmanni TaxID=139649 RepID=UPI0018CD3C9A|nr:alpha-catulin isoform X2 [Teleopsis dalmanni]